MDGSTSNAHFAGYFRLGAKIFDDFFKFHSLFIPDSILNVYYFLYRGFGEVSRGHYYSVIGQPARYMTESSTFRERLAEAFDESPKTVEQLCKEIKLARATWYKYAGPVEAQPSHIRLFQLADALNVTARWLSTGKEPKARVLEGFTQEQLEVAAAWPKLPEGVKDSIRVLINAAVAEKIPALAPAYAAVTIEAQKRASEVLEEAQEEAQAHLGETI